MTLLSVLTVAILGAAVGSTPSQAQQGAAHADEDDPLAQLAALGTAVANTNDPGGSSIRAKKAVDPQALERLRDPRNGEAVVVEVRTAEPGRFPQVALRVRLSQPPKEGQGADLKRGDTVTVIPALRYENKQLALQDAATVRLMGSYYLRAGDRISVRLGNKTGAVYMAEVLERL